MNKIFKTWICLVIMWFIILPGCKKNKPEDSQEEEQTISEIGHKPKGALAGNPVTKTMGQSGGELASADGLIKVKCALRAQGCI
jgi:hypothetical protein